MRVAYGIKGENDPSVSGIRVTRDDNPGRNLGAVFAEKGHPIPVAVLRLCIGAGRPALAINRKIEGYVEGCLRFRGVRRQGCGRHECRSQNELVKWEPHVCNLLPM